MYEHGVPIHSTSRPASQFVPKLAAKSELKSGGPAAGTSSGVADAIDENIVRQLTLGAAAINVDKYAETVSRPLSPSDAGVRSLCARPLDGVDLRSGRVVAAETPPTVRLRGCACDVSRKIRNKIR